MSAELRYGHRKVLIGRRVRHADGREGTISRMDTTWGRSKEGRSGHYAIVHWDGEPYARWQDKAEVEDLELLPAPAMLPPVRTRRVIFKGTKDQVAVRVASMAPMTDERRLGGFERYVEFSQNVVALKRWRIVEVGPEWAPERIAETPSESSQAPSLRSMLTDWD